MIVTTVHVMSAAKLQKTLLMETQPDLALGAGGNSGLVHGAELLHSYTQDRPLRVVSLAYVKTCSYLIGRTTLSSDYQRLTPIETYIKRGQTLAK